MPTGEENIAPDWAHVHFEVACARCGFDLYGQSEPICPSCKLEFEWGDAVPIHSLICENCDYHLYGLNETRCPECGSEFTWEGALDHYRRLQKPLFEYRWRVEPVRSLVRTWWWALWPPKIWSEVDIHDPPKVGPLLFMLVPWMVSLLVVSIAVRSTLEWRYNWSIALPSSWSDDLLAIWNWAVRFAGESYTYTPVFIVAIWLLMSLAALTAFPQSMSRCRVRSIHILRVWTYATPMLVPLYTAGTGTAFLVLIWLAPNSLWLFAASWMEIGWYAVPLAHVVWSTWWAYKKYIRMRHGFWVAVSAQAMAVLATMTVLAVHAASRYW